MRTVHRTTATATAFVAAAAGIALLAPQASAAPVGPQVKGATAAAALCPPVGTKYPHYTNPKVGEFVYDSAIVVRLCSPGFGTADHFQISNSHSSGISGWSGKTTKIPTGATIQTIARPAYKTTTNLKGYGYSQRIYFSYTFAGHVYSFDFTTH